jgi:hypothetical protein
MCYAEAYHARILSITVWEPDRCCPDLQHLRGDAAKFARYGYVRQAAPAAELPPCTRRRR